MNKSKLLTIGNYVISGLLWLLGILTLVFNLIGKWTAWNLAGFGFIGYFPLPLLFGIYVLISPARPDEAIAKKRYYLHNTIIFCVTVAVTVLTLVFSTSWFW